QTIWPYTDLLLHDMGPDLADAGSAEWRTAPLWGLGRNRDVNGNAYFLHDGRARSYLEAVLWHGGEAAAARDAVKALPPSARADLLAFLDSL
ncbi:MAG: di-heme oxidoredictase family protein, partial [Alphaproteobacteria bacterium]